MLAFKGPAQPSPTLGDALNAGYAYLEVRCLGRDTHQTVALDIARRPKTTPIHELERYMRCKDCSEAHGYPCKRSHLVALQRTNSRWPSSTFAIKAFFRVQINVQHNPHDLAPVGTCRIRGLSFSRWLLIPTDSAYDKGCDDECARFLLQTKANKSCYKRPAQ